MYLCMHIEKNIKGTIQMIYKRKKKNKSIGPRKGASTQPTVVAVVPMGQAQVE